MVSISTKKFRVVEDTGWVLDLMDGNGGRLFRTFFIAATHRRWKKRDHLLVLYSDGEWEALRRSENKEPFNHWPRAGHKMSGLLHLVVMRSHPDAWTVEIP